MSDSEKAALSQQITDIEATCFRREPATTHAFPTLIKEWREGAQRSAATSHRSIQGEHTRPRVFHVAPSRHGRPAPPASPPNLTTA